MPNPSRPTTATFLLSVLAVVGSLIGAYLGGYYWLGTRFDEYVSRNGPTIMSIRPLVGGTPVIVRHFKSHWLATLYFPMSKLESAARHTEVMLAVVDESFSPGGAATYQEITVS